MLIQDVFKYVFFLSLMFVGLGLGLHFIEKVNSVPLSLLLIFLLFSGCSFYVTFIAYLSHKTYLKRVKEERK